MKTLTTKKSLEYAYPSSPHAEEYDHASTGCWMVAIYDTEGNEVGRKAYDYKEDAVEAFDSLTIPVYHWSHKH